MPSVVTSTECTPNPGYLNANDICDLPQVTSKVQAQFLLQKTKGTSGFSPISTVDLRSRLFQSASSPGRPLSAVTVQSTQWFQEIVTLK